MGNLLDNHDDDEDEDEDDDDKDLSRELAVKLPASDPSVVFRSTHLRLKDHLSCSSSSSS